jgi:hypothetical protein
VQRNVRNPYPALPPALPSPALMNGTCASRKHPTRVAARRPGSGCKPLYAYDRLVVSEHGRIKGGRAGIKAEIFARGPVSCGVKATENMDKYTGQGG